MTAPRDRPPCRLHFLLAREAPTGLLFRRGPTRWVRLIRWDLAADRFEPGQWFKGRIYEKRCDLSPDGTKLVYFARKINRRTLDDPEISYSWTAVSRPPYLTALALWPKGDCWNGGGLFETSSRLWLNHPSDARAHTDHPPKGLEVQPEIDTRGEDDTVLDKRLSRDGWTLVQKWEGHFVESPFARAHGELMAKGLSFEEIAAESFRLKLHELDTDSRYVNEAPEIRERASDGGRMTLRMTMEVRGLTPVYEFELRSAGSENVLSDGLRGAEWADWDQRGRLAFVRAGKLYVAEPSPRGALRERELADFNAQEPEPMESPDWARQW